MSDDLGLCRTCNAPIRWVTTEKNAKAMPLDRAPDPDGNVIMIRLPYDGKVVAHILTGKEADQLEDTRIRYQSHFATCPNVRRR